MPRPMHEKYKVPAFLLVIGLLILGLILLSPIESKRAEQASTILIIGSLVWIFILYFRDEGSKR